jgi:hypothetical protein
MNGLNWAVVARGDTKFQTHATNFLTLGDVMLLIDEAELVETTGQGASMDLYAVAVWRRIKIYTPIFPNALPKSCVSWPSVCPGLSTRVGINSL